MTAPIPAADAAALALVAPEFTFAVVATRETAIGPARVVDSLCFTLSAAARYMQSRPSSLLSPVIYQRSGAGWRQVYPRDCEE